MCCKTILTTKMSNIDSRTSTASQHESKNPSGDSIFARWRRSEEFCSTCHTQAEVFVDETGCVEVTHRKAQSADQLRQHASENDRVQISPPAAGFTVSVSRIQCTDIIEEGIILQSMAH